MELSPIRWTRLMRPMTSLLFGFAAMACQAGALLQCAVTYAGTTHQLKATPTTSPYAVKAIDIGGRFFFKMVLTESNATLSHVLLYVYLDQEPRPVLLQEAKYMGPFHLTSQPLALTGEQHLYGGPVERELIYSCWLQTAAP